MYLCIITNFKNHKEIVEKQVLKAKFHLLKLSHCTCIKAGINMLSRFNDEHVLSDGEATAARC